MHVQNQAFSIVGTVSYGAQVDHGSANSQKLAPLITRTTGFICSLGLWTHFENSVSAHEAQDPSHRFRKPPTRDVKEIILQSRRDRGIVSSSSTYVDDGIADYLPTLMVLPRPIPILILSSVDYIGSSRIIQGEDGWAAIVPSKKTARDAVRRRGVDKFFRPLFRDLVTDLPVAIPTENASLGVATYTARSIVTSMFGVDLFRVLPESHTSPSTEPFVEYFGVYLMRYIDCVVMSRENWDKIPDDEKNKIYRDWAPHLLEASEPRRHFPITKFSYIKFDANVIGYADMLSAKEPSTEAVMRLQHDITTGVVDDNLYVQDINWDDIVDADDGDILLSGSPRS
ncbi:hypothetical protein F5J12DRAFT_926827 [Pisolithus orientalis]|uniref:uncharacterized protein n=1 Tax=Pisolithus orientalis TaxID=936130 RepID=UPI002224582C|nr:uncharacterized protein F5J12DRAFT_926827 [Pisolithus orientalis]KAI6009445.1 hypothetical protein F5J12DRAFT_926827 [Pisolithus orientalis]